jgi:hypothetical protein
MTNRSLANRQLSRTQVSLFLECPAVACTWCQYIERRKARESTAP